VGAWIEAWVGGEGGGFVGEALVGWRLGGGEAGLGSVGWRGLELRNA